MIPAFPNLLASTQIGSMKLQNRLVFPPMDQNLCNDEGLITDQTIAHYNARARGGTGLLIVETSAVSYPHGATSIHQPAVSHDGVIPGFRRLAETIHKQDAKIVVQLCHHGKTSSIDIAQGRPVLLPSIPPPPADPLGMLSDITDKEMSQMASLTAGQRPTYVAATLSQLEEIVDDFANAAQRVQQAGIDGVEIHGAHGYLLSTFLSPAWNRRTDLYGGSVEGRTRLLVEVIEAIRTRCGQSFSIIVRLDGNEYGATEGITPDDAAKHAQAAEAAGANAVHISATSSDGTGLSFTNAPLPWSPNQYESFAQIIKASINIPVIAVGRIQPVDAERILANGSADLIAMGRQLLADPDLPNRLSENRLDLVRPCINCFLCVAQNFWGGKPICAVNAELGRYQETKEIPLPNQRHVVVVGGGPGGMECARVAAERGHQVTLFEAESKLGGTARLSSLTNPINGAFIDYLETAIRETTVNIQTGVRANSAIIKQLNPDVIVIATGARYGRLNLPGADLNHVLTGNDLRSLLFGQELGGSNIGTAGRLGLRLAKKLRLMNDPDHVRKLSHLWMPIGSHVVIIHGELVGIELAHFLAKRRRQVTVLEPGPNLAEAMAHPRRWRALHESRQAGVKFHTNAEIVSIGPKKVEYQKANQQYEIRADTVIIAEKIQADYAFTDELKAIGYEVHTIGDAAGEFYIEGAVRTGYDTGWTL